MLWTDLGFLTPLVARRLRNSFEDEEAGEGGSEDDQIGQNDAHPIQMVGHLQALHAKKAQQPLAIGAIHFRFVRGRGEVGNGRVHPPLEVLVQRENNDLENDLKNAEKDGKDEHHETESLRIRRRNTGVVWP